MHLLTYLNQQMLLLTVTKPIQILTIHNMICIKKHQVSSALMSDSLIGFATPQRISDDAYDLLAP